MEFDLEGFGIYKILSSLITQTTLHMFRFDLILSKIVLLIAIFSLRPIESSPKAGDTGQKSFYSGYDAQTHQRPSAVTSFLDSQNSGAYVPAKITSLQDLKRTRPPQLLSTDEDGVRNTRRGSTSHCQAINSCEELATYIGKCYMHIILVRNWLLISENVICTY
ncbi:uncharacterized protein LOC114273496 [Camellia sinensis]|uniref:uncharacterized protein LOC114273496 n=1 Tax=Camellia sinensis TaxID=4442 RepID=UPI0010361E36|nr:uncharacterized protein LOC114273496 [Camellia sinensis]